ncbi:protein sarah [Sitodiplosis mosellana]|uniref:protein sarah n=1 Tax=Sitodiplosis mosellana TaxID=263140 RepID=UPI0024443D54|nr:protein sarah [Sitodiplosis mosellana]XP_055297418.1 protein sarah [Sitodiplosis mosellana]XP_055297426.1 protein sarah [Sitodiplosis mosellana]XP_055297434.1 protein sarah [Sitodiplosis mosellana]
MAETQDFNEKFSPDENIFINKQDGLTNQHPILPLEMDDEDFEEHNKKHSPDSDSFDDLPTSLIVTNIHSEVFTNESQREEIENVFKLFSSNVKFQWFRSFRRLRVNFDTAVAAANARIQLHQYQVGKSKINCYFAQPVTPVTHKFLQPPAPYKQFLISPPASPPAGWQPHEEGEPIVNHDLLAALANLMPGESHELQPPSTEHPGIVIHTAKVKDENDDDNDDDDDETDIQAPQRIIQTKCPERA